MRFCDKCGLLYKPPHRICPLDGNALVERRDPFLGRIIAGKYRIMKVIGEGGAGRVFRARHVHMDRQVAVKVLPADASLDAETKERFIREARAANLVRHENIVEIHDLGETREGVPYMIMELLDGPGLEQVIRKGRLPVERAVRIVRQVCSVLGPTHAMGIIHRDLKPENIFLVTRNGQPDFVKVLDFGIAHLAHEPGITREGIVLGTPHYMAPELAMAEKPGPACDLYSLGCIAYEMVSGRPPFHRGSLFEVMTAQVKEPPPALDGVPEPLERILRRLLEKQPSHRHPDAYAVMRDLDAFLPPPRPVRDPHLKLSTPGFAWGAPIEPPTPAMSPDTLRSWRQFTEEARARATKEHARILYEMEEVTGGLESLYGTMESVLLIMHASEEKRRRTGRHIRYAIDRLADGISLAREALASGSSDGALPGRISEMEGRIVELRSELEAVIAETAEQLEESQKRMESLEAEREQAESRLCELSFEIGSPS
jgi:serine/threonine-protein kinase